jgi:glycosyltransferase involved in cell wall biosynthesis
MTRPRLSICIATYNRAEYIGETLESIIPQLTDEVEIVIVDGASTDNTSTIVKSYIEACKQIRYIKLSSKGGVDQDYCKVVEYAQGEMCWLFPDDDLLKPDAVKTVLDEAKNGYSLIVVNAQVMNKNFSEILSSKILQIKTNEVYNKSELDKLFQRVIPYMSFIGCVVINRDLWLQREKKSYFGTEFIHVGVIFQAPLPAPALVIAEPYITIRLGNAKWTPRAFEIWMFKWPNLLCSFTDISKEIKQEYQKTQLWRRFKNIIIHRAKEEYSLKEYRKWLELEDLSLWWRMVMFFIAIVPSSITKLIILSYFKMVNKETIKWWRC